MSNNDELIIRFREMIGKKKSEEKTKSQESFFSGSNSQTKQIISDDEYKIQKDMINDKTRSNKNEYDGKSNIFMDRLRKMRNEVFEDVKETSGITSDKTIKNPNKDEEIDNNNLDNDYKSKPRPSVFDLARRFEKQHKNQQMTTPDKKQNTKLNQNNPTPDKTEQVILNPNEKIEDKNISQNEFVIPNLDDDEFRKYERTSNSRKMMLNSLNKVREEAQQRNSNLLNLKNNSQIMINNSQINHEFRDNIITDIPKRLVKDLIKMNEKRIRSNSENKQTKQRNTVSQRFRNNMSEIRSFIDSLKEKQGDKEDFSQFMRNNEDKLKRYGIDGKDASAFQELIDFYQTNAIDASNRINYVNDQKIRRHRNTVSNIGKTKTIVMQVDPIAEEKDDETSLAESWRKSNSQRMSNQGNKNEANRSEFMQEKLLNESVDSDAILVDDKLINIKIAEDDEVQENLEKKESDIMQHNLSSNNSHYFEMPRNKQLIDTNSLTKLNDSLIEKVCNSNRFETNKIEKDLVINISIPRPKKTFSDLSISNSENSEVTIKSKIREYFKVNELSFNILSDIKSFKNNPEYFKFHKQNQLVLRSTPKMLNLKLSKEYTTSFINFKKSPIISIQNTKHLQLNPTKDRNKQLVMQTFTLTDSTAENQISVKNSQTIEYENNEEQIKFRSKSREEGVSNINSNRIPSISTPHSENPDYNFVKIIDNYQSNTNDSNKYHKNIINSLDSISILQYKLDSRIAFDPTFFDVLCTNCYECIKYDQIDLHSDRCVIQLEENFQDLFDCKEQEEDYNSRIYKLYESLKNRHDEIYSTGNAYLISIYEEFSKLTYEIMLNNNSIEELDKSISLLNDLLNNKLCKLKSKYNFSLLIVGQRISQLVFIKLQDMEKILLSVKANVQLEEIKNDDEINIYHDSDEEIDLENIKEIEILKKELVHLEKQTIDTKKEIEEWRKESKKLEDMLRRPIQNLEVLSDIVSDVISKKEESFDEMTMVTGQTSEHDGNDVGNMRDFNEVLDVHSEEDLKKYFLSIGLSLKFKFGDKIKMNISIGNLYDKAKELNIPISQWYNFIYDELVL